MAHMMVRTLSVALLLTASRAYAYGEVEDGAPNAKERAVHLFTDLLRMDPGAMDPSWSMLSAVDPLQWNADLGAAARFYAEDMVENGCFPANHSSCDGTSFGDRVSSFYSGGAIGENIAQGYPDSAAVVLDGWLYSDGHRANLMDGGWNEIGVGFANGGPGPTWVQDFGAGSGLSTVVATSGTAWPLSSSDGASEFLLSVHDPAGPVVSVVTAYADRCETMSLHVGDEARGGWSLDASGLDDGCVPYWFVVERASGDTVRYPTTGALVLPVGGASCEEFLPIAPASACAPDAATGDDDDGGGGGGGGRRGAGCETIPAEGPNSAVEDDVSYGSCDVGGRPVGTLLALALLTLRRRTGRVAASRGSP